MGAPIVSPELIRLLQGVGSPTSPLDELAEGVQQATQGLLAAQQQPEVAVPEEQGPGSMLQQVANSALFGQLGQALSAVAEGPPIRESIPAHFGGGLPPEVVLKMNQLVEQREQRRAERAQHRRDQVQKQVEEDKDRQQELNMFAMRAKQQKQMAELGIDAQNQRDVFDARIGLHEAVAKSREAQAVREYDREFEEREFEFKKAQEQEDIRQFGVREQRYGAEAAARRAGGGATVFKGDKTPSFDVLLDGSRQLRYHDRDPVTGADIVTPAGPVVPPRADEPEALPEQVPIASIVGGTRRAFAGVGFDEATGLPERDKPAFGAMRSGMQTAVDNHQLDYTRGNTFLEANYPATPGVPARQRWWGAATDAPAVKAVPTPKLTPPAERPSTKASGTQTGDITTSTSRLRAPSDLGPGVTVPIATEEEVEKAVTELGLLTNDDLKEAVAEGKVPGAAVLADGTVTVRLPNVTRELTIT